MLIKVKMITGTYETCYINFNTFKALDERSVFMANIIPDNKKIWIEIVDGEFLEYLF